MCEGRAVTQRQFYLSGDNFIQRSALRLRGAMMNKLSIFTDTVSKQEAIRRQLSGIFELTFLELDHIHAAQLQLQPSVLFDINLRDNERLPEIKEWLGRKS